MSDRLKTPAILYVDIYPYFFDADKGEPLFLFLKRREDIELPETWQAISGKIQKNERIAQAFWRQVKEKTGLAPKKLFKIDYINSFYDAYYDTIMMVPVAACEMASKKVTLSPLHTDYVWATAEEAKEYLIWPNQRKSIQLIAEMLQSNHITAFHLIDDQA